ncbi:hypothetical protein AV521_00055 [Streptomyces sp. IMTB 2501]|nr:hypothetical protein AV521_00055 [Streptomyces sp. IMTB 2501]
MSVARSPRRAQDALDAQPTRQAVLDAVLLPAGWLLGRAGDGFRIAMNGRHGGRIGIAACSTPRHRVSASPAGRPSRPPPAHTGYSVADRALQRHGGHGCLSEYGIQKNVRDLRVHQFPEGTDEIMRVIVARGLTEAFG